MSRTLVYIAGPYSAPTKEGIQANIDYAHSVNQKIWRTNAVVAICPHANTAHMSSGDSFSGTAESEQCFELFLSGDEEMLLRCDAIVMLPKWKESRGARREWDFANTHGIPVYHWDDKKDWAFDVDGNPLVQHPTSALSPVQCLWFMSTLMQMYRTHLDKNADYSPSNILGTGTVGAVVRLWDKMARLMNLMGFELKIAEPTQMRAPKQAKNESILDTFIDLANYAIIAFLLWTDRWGR